MCNTLTLQLHPHRLASIEVMGLVEQIYNRAKLKYGAEAGSSFPAKLLQDELDESLAVPGFEDWAYTIHKPDAVEQDGTDNGPPGIAIVHQNIRTTPGQKQGLKSKL